MFIRKIKSKLYLYFSMKAVISCFHSIFFKDVLFINVLVFCLDFCCYVTWSDGPVHGGQPTRAKVTGILQTKLPPGPCYL